MENAKRLGRLFKKRRIDKNMTAKELAEKMGVTRQSISFWETGKKEPSGMMLIKLGHILDLTIEDILTAVDDDFTPTEREEITVDRIIRIEQRLAKAGF